MLSKACKHIGFDNNICIKDLKFEMSYFVIYYFTPINSYLFIYFRLIKVSCKTMMLSSTNNNIDTEKWREMVLDEIQSNHEK